MVLLETVASEATLDWGLAAGTDDGDDDECGSDSVRLTVGIRLDIRPFMVVAVRSCGSAAIDFSRMPPWWP